MSQLWTRTPPRTWKRTALPSFFLTVLGYLTNMTFLLWLLAVILVVAGIVEVIRGAWVLGLILIIVGFLVGPGGVSLFT